MVAPLQLRHLVAMPWLALRVRAWALLERALVACCWALLCLSVQFPHPDQDRTPRR